MNDLRLSILSGRSSQKLAAAAANSIGVDLARCEIRTYADGELSVEIVDNIRGNDVFVFQSTSTPVNDYILELLIIIDALKRASARRITAVIPYYGYSRQDRKTQPRVPITAKLVADLIVTAGANRVLTMDLHAGQIMGFFNVPVDNLYARPVILRYLRERYVDSNICIVSPDAGGVARARAFATRFKNSSLAIIDKRRTKPNEVAEMNVVGAVEGKVAIIIDDIIDTGGTLIKASDALIKAGAEKVIASATHAVLSDNALERLSKSSISELIITDTINQDNLDSYKPLVTCLSVASLIGEAVARIHREDSISILFGD